MARFDWTADRLALLGTDLDQVIAGRIGTTRDAVKSMRLKRRVPAFRTPEREWTPAEVAMLGELGDGAIAKLTGRSTLSVTQERKARGIPGASGSPPKARL